MDKEASNLDSLGWADRGRVLSVSSRSGCLYTLVVRAAEEDNHHGTLHPHSLAACATRPLPVVELLILLVVVLLAVLVQSAWWLGVPLSDLQRAILDLSEIV